MTGKIYVIDELDGLWEFKTVHSHTGAFSNPRIVRDVLNAEALAGWHLVEKPDNWQLRFKRLRAHRKRDHLLPKGADPYRTLYGPSALQVLILIVAIGGMALLACPALSLGSLMLALFGA